MILSYRKSYIWSREKRRTLLLYATLWTVGNDEN